jgi:hypothetical protein
VIADSKRVSGGISAEPVTPYISAISAAIAGFGLIFVARSFRYTSKSFDYTEATFKSNDLIRQIETASEIIADIHNLEKQLYDIVVEKKKLEVDIQYVEDNPKEETKIKAEIDLINLKQKVCMNTIFNKLEWIAFCGLI